jgi:hypothetical protein
LHPADREKNDEKDERTRQYRTGQDRRGEGIRYSKRQKTGDEDERN